MLVLGVLFSFGKAQTTYESPEIVDISISGNSHLSTTELLAQIHLKEKRLFSTGSFYNSHHLAREIKKLENYYTLNGFLDVGISDSLSLGKNNEVSIFLKVIEGKQYYLRNVNISGNQIFTDQEYLDIIEHEAGSSFNTFLTRENLLEVVSIYRDKGYALINIQDSVVVDDSVDYYIKVIEGPKLNIGDIHISEVDQVQKHVISREIIVKPGDVFNSSNIEESKRRLYETSLFNSVNIRMGQVDLDLSTINLDVEVVPAKFRAFDMNLGVKQGVVDEGADPVLGVGLSGSWYNNNLFDRSRRIRIQAKLSSIYPAIVIPQQFELNFFYVEPWLSKFRLPLTINPFYWYIDKLRASTPYKNTAYGLRAIITYRWFRKIKVQSLAEWSLSYSEGTPTETDETYEEARKVGVKFTWDERDNYFYPHHGFKMVIEPGIVGYVLGGENNYMQLQTSFSSYWNVFADVVFAHNINLAVAVQKDQDVAIPYEKRFFLGGNSSIRGYEQQMLGPMTLLNEPTGGNFRFYTNFEFRFPLYKLLGGEVFADVGNLWSEIKDANVSELRTAVGAGLTIETPIGPARIDYGIPVGSNSDSKNGQTHIAIAYVF